MEKRYRIKTKEQMENEFGLGWNGQPEVDGGWTCGMNHLCGQEHVFDFDKYRYEVLNDWSISKDMCEEVKPTIPEKTIKDFPLVEVSWDGKYWEQVRYTYTDSEGSFFDSEGEYWNHMRPIQKVDVDSLKNKARLV